MAMILIMCCDHIFDGHEWHRSIAVGLLPYVQHDARIGEEWSHTWVGIVREDAAVMKTGSAHKMMGPEIQLMRIDEPLRKVHNAVHGHILASL